ncbi:MAG: polyprenol monophosphomannose synthase [Thermomicrobiales bacterium]
MSETQSAALEIPAPNVLVLVPTFNERANIREVIERILAAGSEFSVLVIDDSSPDGTGEIASRAAREFPDRVFVLHRGSKQGIGRAYLAGFAWALPRDFTHFVTMDADLSHDPADLPRFLAASQRADLVLGSRYVDGGSTEGWPRGRLALSWLGGHYAKTVLGVPVDDLTGGFKLYTRQALESLPLGEIRSDGYVFQIETTYRVLRTGLNVLEIPIRFVDRVAGKSKLSRKIVFEAIVVVWRLRLQRPAR